MSKYKRCKTCVGTVRETGKQAEIPQNDKGVRRVEKC